MAISSNKNSNLERITFSEEDGGMTVDCYLDGGADAHFIREEIAKEAGLKIYKLAQPRRYEMGNKKLVEVNWATTATIRLGGEEMTRRLNFEVLEDLAYPIVIGNTVVGPEMQIELKETRLRDEEEDERLDVRSVPLVEEMTFELPRSSGLEGVDKLVMEFKDVFREEVTEQPADTYPLALEVLEGGIQRLRQRLRHSPRLIPQKFQAEVKRQLDQMLMSGVIEKAPSSDFASQLLIVRKSSGALRMCVDYRDVNKETVPNHWPLPRIKDLIERLAHKSFYGTIDLCAGYWQIEMAESSRRLTTFTTPFGNFRFRRIPFGLSQAPGHFQRVISQQVLAGLSGRICESYIDDIIVYGDSQEEFVNNLREVLEALRKYGIKAKGSKCDFGKSEIKYLGLNITAAGYSMDPERKDFVAKFARPENIRQMRAFLGTMNFFKDFIPDFGTVSAPLWAFLQGKPTRKDIIRWTDESIEAFEKLRGLAANSSVLVFPEEEGDLILYSDASDVAIGGVLMQREANGEERPVQFISKALNSAQKNYSVTEREMLALVHCIKSVDYFLAGRPFQVYTDHQPLLSTKLSESPRVERWKVALSQYTFSLNYIKGEENDLADAMSRLVLMGARAEEEPEAAVEDTPGEPEKGEWEQTIQRRRALLKRTHEGGMGHLGVSAMCSVILEAGSHWSGITQDIRDWVANCPVCHRIKSARNLRGEAFCFEALAQNQIWAVDTMILDSAAQGQSTKQFVLVAVDVFSRFTMLRPLETLTGKEAVATFNSLIADFGKPGRIHTDNASQFVNSEVNTFLNAEEVEHTTSIPYHHEGNAIAERAIQTVRNTLAAFQKQNPAKLWPDLLPKTQWALNNRPHGGIFGFRPHDVFYRKYEAGGASMAAQLRAGEHFDEAFKKRKASEQVEAERKRPHTEVAINDAPGRRGVAQLEDKKKDQTASNTTPTIQTPVGISPSEGEEKGEAESAGSGPVSMSELPGRVTDSQAKPSEQTQGTDRGSSPTTEALGALSGRDEKSQAKSTKSTKAEKKKAKAAGIATKISEVSPGDMVLVQKQQRAKSNAGGDRYDGPFEVSKVASRAITLVDLEGGRERLVDVSALKRPNTRAKTLRDKLQLGLEIDDAKISRIISYRARSNYSKRPEDFWITIEHKEAMTPVELPLTLGGLQQCKQFHRFAELHPRLMPFVVKQ